ncbi:MAG: hypothetical protein AVDCRST_MAG78-47 [uncultured Rubrobacteraceae bacterium]|uniref:Uncharacterized protein n=1 Tax=uncultured Rubrobacteraceae bacterium TaxID=349277 RepID=A0A6J4P2T8_9ACTN|nr:MAG: hypothetical protein AVDCRST_MAG78-47 [uncultured Rubrobacteraceae bacterium]
MRRFWAVTFGAPGEPQIGIMATPKPEGPNPAGKKTEHGSEHALCLFDSEEAARGFWQEAEEFNFSEYIAAQYGSRPVYFVPIHPTMLAEFVRTVGHPFVAVNPSVFGAKEEPFLPAEEFLDSV